MLDLPVRPAASLRGGKIRWWEKKEVRKQKFPFCGTEAKTDLRTKVFLLLQKISF